MRRGSARLLLAESLLGAAAVASDPHSEHPEIEIHRVYEAVWTSDVARADPWSIEVRADVRGPSGIAFSVPAFPDGGGIWKARFRPTAVGSWSYRTVSRELDLNGRIGRVRCVPAREEPCIGPIFVDPEDPTRFALGGGARPFFLGVVCTRLCTLDPGPPPGGRLDPFLDRLRERGFNWVVFATNPGRGADPGRAASAPCGPWPCGISGPDFLRLDPSFWERVDRAVEGLRSRGMVAHIQLRGPPGAPAPPPGSRQDWNYLRHVVARYHAFPNVVWDYGPASWREGDRAHRIEAMLRVGEWDPYGRPRTVCDDDAGYAGGAYDFLSFRSLRIRRAIGAAVEESRRSRPRPIVVVGYGTETDSAFQTVRAAGFDDPRSAEEIVLRSWEIALAAAIPIAAAAEISWDLLLPEAEPASWRKLGILRRTLEAAGDGLRPAPELIRAGKAMCLARPGASYLAFLEEERLVTIRFRGIEGRLPAIWLDPETGDVRDAGLAEDGDLTFHRPEGFGRLGAVLRVGPPPSSPSREPGRLLRDL